MNNYEVYQRGERRSRTARNQPQQNDIAGSILTAQIIICILILIAAVILKKVNEQYYSDMYEEYNILITNPQSQNPIDIINTDGGIQEIFRSIEDGISGFLGRIAGNSLDSTPKQDIPEVDEQPDQPVYEWNYDYLEAVGVRPTVSLPAGGAFPVDTGGKSYNSLPAPEGSTFAQVMISSKPVPPVTGIITSEFSYREHPVNGDDDFHTGMDIAAADGSDILAAFPGTVIDSGWSDIYGNYIKLEHASNLQTFYAHCSEIIAQEGTNVKQGERIATVGSTGLTTGPHLHFSVLVDGNYTDPYWALKENIKLVD